jgi:hypothetical protein
MNAQRYQSYLEAQSLIDRMSGSKLHPDEEGILRDAAEGLLLHRDPSSEEADELRARASDQLASLVESDRWLPETAETLLGAIEGCCPTAEAAVA